MQLLQRELSTYPIAPVHKTKLCAAGFLTVEDLKNMKPSELSKETGINMEEALEILKLVFGDGSGDGVRSRPAPRPTISALEILQEEQTLPYIITFSQRLDEMLGGGVPLCKITEFCGAPGIGKTQMCMQLSVDVQIPECFGGLGGEAVYIDTEGSFIVERLVDIANSTVEHCSHMADMDKGQDTTDELRKFNLEKVLSGVHYFRCHDYVELLATVNILTNFLKQHTAVKIVIVDSVAFHFRHDFDDLSLRTRLLTSMAQSFIKMATNFKLAVVLTNQMTTKVRLGGDNSHLVPALGESWGHASTIRVILHWDGNQRYAWLYKSPSRKEAVVPYQVTMGGIRDMITESEHDLCDRGEEVCENPTKRQKVS